ncbi:protein ADM2 [Oenanthe melanoleuca]|uniref:protein ADM2 n=1 Tax=Oenanthe melanoleuca TaxID=2939378 RepID=UPI0024C10883|nr:protein ADM2 [Oenanthe melanoleuca]
MRAPAPLALGCVSFALCLLELPHGRALPARRVPPARSPPQRIPALPRDPPAPQPFGTLRHRALLARHGPWVATRHRPLAPRPPPWHVRRLILRHDPRHDPRAARGRRHDPRHDPRAARGRRHAGAHLVRVGCVLGTCQVQNLSHRLWQLRGQSGRRDSSPMNPNSPHSYG